jgi:hypothetical protein
VRKFFVLAVLSLVLAGCGRSFERSHALALQARLDSAPAPDMVVAGNAVANGNQLFSYMHTLALLMPRASVEPRYGRARERCLHDAKLGCKLLSSSLEKAEFAYSAQLVVALPHDKIAAFERDLAAPISGEAPGDAKITSSTTTAQNVSQDAATAHRKVAQLSNYRDRLLALLKRPNLSVDDLIKVEGELSKTQSDLDDALSQKSDVDDRVAREQLSVFLAERHTVGAFQAIGDVWESAMEILSDSTADALRFLIQIVPWLPIVAAAIFLLRWLWRIARRRPSDARSAPDK